MNVVSYDSKSCIREYVIRGALREDAFRNYLVLSCRVVMVLSIRFDLLSEVDGEQVTHAAMRFIWYCSIAHVAMRFR